jgi:hypothetical protein
MISKLINLIIFIGIFAFVVNVTKSNDLIYITKAVVVLLFAIYIQNIKSND